MRRPSYPRVFSLLFTLVVLARAERSEAQATAQPGTLSAPPPPAQVAPVAPPAPAQAYPQQAYPQQAYPQQAYPQQAYPQQAYPQQAYPQQQVYPQTYPPPAYAPPYVQPTYVAQPARPRPPRPKRGLMVGGISVLVGSYAVALFTGAGLVDTKCCEDVGWSLFIPLAGPYLAADKAEHARGALVLLGTVQVIGAGLTIGGIVQFVRSKNRGAETALQLKLPHGRSLALDASASPYMAGPRMRLRF